MGVSSWNEMDLSVNGRAVNDAINEELRFITECIESSSINPEVEEITICDSHSRGENVPYGKIANDRVTLIRGYPREFYMMQGLDESYAAVMLVGYHARIGSFRGLMDHSYSSSCIYNVRINGEAVGEVEINAYLAGFYDVPVCLVTGDDVLAEQIKGFYGNGFPYVLTKEGIGRFSGKMFHPDRIKKSYSREVDRMLKILSGEKDRYIKKIEGEIELQIDLVNTVAADAVSIIPDLVRMDGRTVKYLSSDFRKVYKMIVAVAMLGGKYVSFR